MQRLKHWFGDKLELLSLGAPLSPGPTAICALGIHHRWDAEGIMILLSAYGDESGTHSPEYQMLAGYVGRFGRINVFDKRWKRRLKREGLDYFHSVEHTRRRDLQPMCWDLLKLCGKFLVFGFVIRLDKAAYDEFYIGKVRPKGFQFDTMYGVCYRYMVSFFIRELPNLLGRNDIYVNTMLELGAPGSKDALRIHAKIRKDHPVETTMIGEPVFGEKKKFPGLQAADSLAHPAFREEKTNPELIAFPTGNIADARRVTSFRSVIPLTFYLRLNERELTALKTDILYGAGIEQKLLAATRPAISRRRPA